MSHRHSHYVRKIVSKHRANSTWAAELASRFPGITQAEAKEILTYLEAPRRARGGVRFDYDRMRAFLGRHKAQLTASGREGAAIAGAFMVLLITACLIWAAFAEAALARAGAA